MIPRYHRHLIYQGSDYQCRYSFRNHGQPINLTGYTFTSSIYLLGEEIAQFTVIVPNPLNGEVHLKLDDAITATLGGKYTHTLRMVNPLGDISYPLAGDLIVRAQR